MLLSPVQCEVVATPSPASYKPGIYHVRFNSSLGVGSEGLVVLKDGTINGGDIGYIYSGRLRENNGEIHARLKIRKWNRGVFSIIGRLSEFELEFKGRFSADYVRFEVKGFALQSLGVGITVRGERVGDAA